MAKQKVALECLSYHATATQNQTEELIKDHIPSAEAYTLYSFTFNGNNAENILIILTLQTVISAASFPIDFELDDEDTCRATIRMFLQCNLVQQFHVPYDVSVAEYVSPERRIVRGFANVCLSLRLPKFLGSLSLDIEREEEL